MTEPDIPFVAEFREEVQRAATVGCGGPRLSTPPKLEANMQGASSTRRLRPVTRGVAGVGAGALAAVIAVAVLVFGGTAGTPPAYALTSNGNGSYTLTLNDLTTGIPAINAKLKQMDIPATVVPVEAGCTASSFDPVQSGAVAASQTVTFSSGNIPAAMQMYIAAEQAPASGQVLFAQGTTAQPIPACFPTTTSHGIPAGS